MWTRKTTSNLYLSVFDFVVTQIVLLVDKIILCSCTLHDFSFLCSLDSLKSKLDSKSGIGRRHLDLNHGFFIGVS